jgi:hypothetical protein
MGQIETEVAEAQAGRQQCAVHRQPDRGTGRIGRRQADGIVGRANPDQLPLARPHIRRTSQHHRRRGLTEQHAAAADIEGRVVATSDPRR